MQSISSRTWSMLWNGRIGIELSIYARPNALIKHISYTAELCEITPGGFTCIFNADVLLTQAIVGQIYMRSSLIWF
jgi:hypothetical protein